MAHYVLVHGAWGGGSYYLPLAAALRAAGHEASIVSLTGLGARSHLSSPSIDLAMHVEDVVAQIELAGLDQFVLVGHSYGGMVITGVAGRLGGRIAHMVYLDAFVPGDGQSVWDMVGDWEHRYYIDGQRDTPGLIAPLPEIEADAPPGVVFGRQPLLTLLQPLRFTGREEEVASRTYVFASGWQPTPFTRFYEQLRDDPAWKVYVLRCGHGVMIDEPEETLRILLAAA